MFLHHPSCLSKQWNREWVLWPEMKQSSTTCYYLFATLQLVTYFPHFTHLCHKKRLTNELLAEGNCYRTPTRASPSLEKTSMSTHSEVFKILLLTLRTKGIQILPSFPPLVVKISQPACSSVRNYLACALLSHKYGNFPFPPYFLKVLKRQDFKPVLSLKLSWPAEIPSAGSKKLTLQTQTPHTLVIKAPQLGKLS